MTFLQILKNSSLPRKEVEILVSFLIYKDRSFLLAHPETIISQSIYKKFLDLEKKRLANWSIAVLIGEKEFYGLNFRVDKNVLVPRPETEIIIDEIKQLKIAEPLIIDLGTGSGAIITTLAKNIKLSGTEFMAIDISALALKVAKQNAKIHKLDKIIKFYQGNLLEPIQKKLFLKNLIIAANLPYLTKSQINSSPSIKREPTLALDGGENGLKYYKLLFKQLEQVDYNSLFLIIEIDPEQTKILPTLFKKSFPKSSIKIIKDFSSKNRFILFKN